MTTPTGTPNILRHPRLEDGTALWELAKDNGLDLNSPYSYLLMCTHFAGTCLVAEMDGEAVGYVTAYRPPSHPDAIFVWQIAVAEKARRTGLARRMVHGVLESPECKSAHYLEATVTESNAASAGLFRSISKELGAEFTQSRMFETNHFPVSGSQEHEPELLLRIGPFDL